MVPRELPKPGPHRGLSTAAGSAEAGACQLHEADIPGYNPCWSALQLHLLASDLKGAMWSLTRKIWEYASSYVLCQIISRVLRLEQRPRWGKNLRESYQELEQSLVFRLLKETVVECSVQSQRAAADEQPDPTWYRKVCYLNAHACLSTLWPLLGSTALLQCASTWNPNCPICWPPRAWQPVGFTASISSRITFLSPQFSTTHDGAWSMVCTSLGR